MRMRVGLIKKLVLGGATALSLVGFVSPAAFAWDGGNGNSGSNDTVSFSSDNNFNDNQGNCDSNFGCNGQQCAENSNDMDWDWDDTWGNNGSSNKDCMNHEGFFQLSSFNDNNRNHCDW